MLKLPLAKYSSCLQNCPSIRSVRQFLVVLGNLAPLLFALELLLPFLATIIMVLLCGKYLDLLMPLTFITLNDRVKWKWCTEKSLFKVACARALCSWSERGRCLCLALSQTDNGSRKSEQPALPEHTGAVFINVVVFCTAALQAVRFRWKYGVGFGSQLCADVVVHRDCRCEQQRGTGGHVGPYTTKRECN